MISCWHVRSTVILSGRTARKSGFDRMASTRSGRPTMSPHWGPAFKNLLACGSVVESCSGQAGSAVVDPGASAYSGWLAAGRILSEGS